MSLRRPSLVVAALVTALFSVACSQNGEGQRCDSKSFGNGGNDDCESPLVCTPASKLRSQVDLCCPLDPREATVPECIPGGSAPVDAGADSGGGGSKDAGSDAATDAGVDASLDAAADTAAEAAGDAPSDAAPDATDASAD